MTAVVVVECALGTGRLQGPVCTAEHTFREATPGRQDACFVGPNGCRHLVNQSAVFDSEEEAFDAMEACAIGR